MPVPWFWRTGDSEVDLRADEEWDALEKANRERLRCICREAIKELDEEDVRAAVRKR